MTSFNEIAETEWDFLEHRTFATENIPYCREYLQMIPRERQEQAGSQFRISRDCGVTFGPILSSPIISPHGPIELQDGSILWVGRTFNKACTVDGEEEGVKAYRLNPDGSMERLGEIKEPRDEQGTPLGQFHEPFAFQLEAGRILCHLRIEPQFTLYQCESTDGGRHWSEPYPILPERGGAPSHIMEHSSGVLIAGYSYRLPPLGGIRMMFSTDGGKSWDTDHILFETGFQKYDLGYPATIELEDGSLLTVFYAHPDDGKSYTSPYESPSVIWQQRWKIVK